MFTPIRPVSQNWNNKVVQVNLKPKYIYIIIRTHVPCIRFFLLWLINWPCLLNLKASTLLQTYDNILTEPISSVQAKLYLDTIKTVAVGLCQGFQGIDALLATADNVYSRLNNNDLSSAGTTPLPVSCDGTCAEVDYPATVKRFYLKCFR